MNFLERPVRKYNFAQSLFALEARSGSMDPALITPEYVYRMWGGKVLLEDSSISKITYLCNKIYHADN